MHIFKEMCIILGPVKSVAKTRIFVAPSLDYQRQIVAYSNEVAAGQETMMVLPVPYPETVQFHESVMRYKGLFRDLQNSMHRVVPEYLGATTLSATRSPPPPLEIFNVGSYRVSVAMNIADLDRLSQDVFSLPDEVRYMLEHTYGPHELPIPYGFICCIMRPGSNKYEPIVYSHRAMDGHLFVPTKHFHSHENSFGIREVQSRGEKYAEDWDHEIYSVGTDPSAAQDSAEYQPKMRNEVRWRSFPPPFEHSTSTPVYFWERRGMFVNRDLTFPFARPASPRTPSSPQSPHTSSYEKLFRGLWGAFN